jgi:hypothetical protein
MVQCRAHAGAQAEMTAKHGRPVKSSIDFRGKDLAWRCGRMVTCCAGVSGCAGGATTLAGAPAGVAAGWQRREAADPELDTSWRRLGTEGRRLDTLEPGLGTDRNEHAWCYGAPVRRFSSYGPVDPSENFCVQRRSLVETCTAQLMGNPDKGGYYFTLWAPRQSGKTWIMRRAIEEIRARHGDRFQAGALSMQGVVLDDDSPEEAFFTFVPHRFQLGFGVEAPLRGPGSSPARGGTSTAPSSSASTSSTACPPSSSTGWWRCFATST